MPTLHEGPCEALLACDRAHFLASMLPALFCESLAGWICVAIPQTMPTAKGSEAVKNASLHVFVDRPRFEAFLVELILLGSSEGSTFTN